MNPRQPDLAKILRKVWLPRGIVLRLTHRTEPLNQEQPILLHPAQQVSYFQEILSGFTQLFSIQTYLKFIYSWFS